MTLFDFVKSSLSVVDVIGEYLQLKPAGNYLKSSCPFHSEKDASFTVSPEKGIFYCFGCHATGDLISFVAKIENLSQIEAVKFLIDKYSLQIPDHVKNSNFKDILEQIEKKDVYFDLSQIFADWAHAQLLSNEIALKYLAARSIDMQDITYFKIGYFPAGIKFINNLLRAVSEKKYLAKDLVEAGILSEGKSILYSPFEERIIFPIFDVMGRAVGFGGRIFKPEDQRPKYYNSKENNHFFKGKILFGLNLAKKDMQDKGYAFLVEGYTDCVAMVKNGYKNTVATLGTACTHEHLKLLSRYINTLYVMYDGDQAGQNAILRLTQLCWDVNLELKIIKLEKSYDPASFLNSGGNLNLLFEKSKDIFTFYIDSLSKDFLESPLAIKLSLADKILDLISNIKDDLKQEILLQQASRALQVSAFSLKKQLKGHFYKKEEKKEISNFSQDFDSKENKIDLLEERIFSVIINSMNKPEKFNLDKILVIYFSEKIRDLLQKLEKFEKIEDFLGNLEDKDKKFVLYCSLKYENETTKELFEQMIALFCKKHWKKIVQDVKDELVNVKQQNDVKKYQEILNSFYKLKEGIFSRGLI